MYYPEVHPGDEFTPDSLLANGIRRLLNATPAAGDPGARPAAAVSPDITVCARNTGTAAIAAGQPAQFPGGAPDASGEIVPVCGFTSSDLPWGIAVDSIAAGDIGECLVQGIATVALTSGTGRFAQPVPASGTSGATFARGTATGLPILAEYADGTVTRGIVAAGVVSQAGGGGGTVAAAYAGPFAVTFSGTTASAGGTSSANVGIAVVRGGCVRRGTAEDAVPGGTVALSGTACGVYLAARYDTATYAVSYAFEAATSSASVPCPAGRTQYVQCLARISDGTVTQTQYGDLTVTGVWL